MLQKMVWNMQHAVPLSCPEDLHHARSCPHCVGNREQLVVRPSCVRPLLPPQPVARAARFARTQAQAPSTSVVPRAQPSHRRGPLRLRDARSPSTQESRGGTWPPVKVVPHVGGSTLTRGQNPPLTPCGSTADGMPAESAHRTESKVPSFLLL